MTSARHLPIILERTSPQWNPRDTPPFRLKSCGYIWDSKRASSKSCSVVQHDSAISRPLILSRVHKATTAWKEVIRNAFKRWRAERQTEWRRYPRGSFEGLGLNTRHFDLVSQEIQKRNWYNASFKCWMHSARQVIPKQTNKNTASCVASQVCRLSIQPKKPQSHDFSKAVVRRFAGWMERKESFV